MALEHDRGGNVRPRFGAKVSKDGVEGRGARDRDPGVRGQRRAVRNQDAAGRVSAARYSSLKMRRPPSRTRRPNPGAG
jgi:hypothetical protein